MGHVGAARRSVYCASKYLRWQGFTKAMATQLAPHNIRVNSIGPTFPEMLMTCPFLRSKAFRDEVLAKIKLGRLGQLDEITGAIVFLVSHGFIADDWLGIVWMAAGWPSKRTVVGERGFISRAVCRS